MRRPGGGGIGYGIGVLLSGLLLAGYGGRRVLDRLARRQVPLPPPAAVTDGGECMIAPVVLAPASPPIALEAAPEDAGQFASVAAAGIDAIAGEYLLYAGDALTRERLQALAAQYGVAVLGVQGNVLRVRAGALDRLDAFLRAVPGEVVYEANVRVRIPPLAEPDAALPPPPQGYVGFGDQALAWLGVPDPSAAWGRGVTVAVLDTGISGDLARQRIDLVGQGTVGAHGTLVAGIVAGMLPGASILDVQVMDAEGTGDAFTVAQGIYAAVEAGADVINMSIGTRGDSRVLAEAVQYALAAGVVVVASAGNEGQTSISYPAAYEGVLGVAAVDAQETHLHISNRGEQVDLAAPGVGVSVAHTGGEPVVFSGTSAAAPFVSATAGLALGQDPALDGAAVPALLIGLANDAGMPGDDDLTGAGVVSPARVLEKDETGIVDMAVLQPVFQEGAAGHVAAVTVAAQNRGTVDLAHVEMQVVVNTQEYLLDFTGVGRGLSIAHQLEVQEEGPSGEQTVDVSVQVRVPGDARPENNQIRALWLPVSP